MKILFESNILKNLFKNVYFINGTAYAGKSTMVRLLAEKYGGIQCGENYHDELLDLIDSDRQPNLSYTRIMRDWQEFISRSPEEYDAWITGCSAEAAELELIKLIQLAVYDKPIFVDTNIHPSMLHEISDYGHVAIMLAPQSMSVERFFDREDAEKQFIYRQIMAASDPEKAMANYRAILAKVNSREHYREFSESGFYTIIRREDSTIPETLSALEKHFRLT